MPRSVQRLPNSYCSEPLLLARLKIPLPMSGVLFMMDVALPSSHSELCLLL
uniref:Uncharacterized protein n=1 Tax=Picea glauca TaxID=3330 RepID=A0A101LY47_PICGL|nr:hypothetical protein ABT39_MTgene5673 [Picea glauca]